jgi:hypothetical protein
MHGWCRGLAQPLLCPDVAGGMAAAEKRTLQAWAAAGKDKAEALFMRCGDSIFDDSTGYGVQFEPTGTGHVTLLVSANVRTGSR